MEIENFNIYFNEMEMEAIKLMAHFRSDHKISDKNSKQYEISLRAHYLGLTGEYAVAKAINGFFDPMPKPNGDLHSGDVIADLDGSVRISVKTTTHAPPLYKIKNLEELEQVTHIALCHFNEPSLRIVWLHKKEYLLDSHFERSFDYGDRICCF